MTLFFLVLRVPEGTGVKGTRKSRSRMVARLVGLGQWTGDVKGPCGDLVLLHTISRTSIYLRAKKVSSLKGILNSCLTIVRDSSTVGAMQEWSSTSVSCQLDSTPTQCQLAKGNIPFK